MRAPARAARAPRACGSTSVTRRARWRCAAVRSTPAQADGSQPGGRKYEPRGGGEDIPHGEGGEGRGRWPKWGLGGSFGPVRGLGTCSTPIDSSESVGWNLAFTYSRYARSFSSDHLSSRAKERAPAEGATDAPAIDAPGDRPSPPRTSSGNGNGRPVLAARMCRERRASRSASCESLSSKTMSNREMRGVARPVCECSAMCRSIRPPFGFVAAMTVHLVRSLHTMPALATEMVCCSIASSTATRSSFLIESNSSTQHNPPSARTSAPASSIHSPFCPPSFTAVHVRPAAVEPIPVVSTERAESFAAYRRTCDLPVPASPTRSMWDSPRTCRGGRRAGGRGRRGRGAPMRDEPRVRELAHRWRAESLPLARRACRPLACVRGPISLPVGTPRAHASRYARAPSSPIDPYG